MSTLTSSLFINDGKLEQLIEQLSQLPSYTIGRGADNRIVIPNAKVSSRHARLTQCTPTSFVLEDLDSKNGTFVNGVRITRKVVDHQDALRLAETECTAEELLSLRGSGLVEPAPAVHTSPEQPAPAVQLKKAALDYTREFADLKQVSEQYPHLRRACRNREKMIRTGSVVLSSIVGIGAALTTGGGALALVQVMSGAGLGVLVPTLCSTFLSTDEKLEIIDKEYRERYRCPNPNCRDPFGTREWEALAHQKTCRRCQAVWVN